MVELSGTAEELVDPHLASSARARARSERRRTIFVCKVTDRALVLGSTQATTDADRSRCARLGVAVVRRRSGGGAVFVSPGSQVWVDAFLPAGDALLLADVGRSFLWFGELWAKALSAALAAKAPAVGRIEVAAPGGPSSSWGRRLCFGSLGAGEVTIAGRKVVGLSQRRDREGASFHSMGLVADHTDDLLGCLDLGDGERSQAAAHLRRVAGLIPVAERPLAEAVLKLVS